MTMPSTARTAWWIPEGALALPTAKGLSSVHGPIEDCRWLHTLHGDPGVSKRGGGGNYSPAVTR